MTIIAALTAILFAFAGLAKLASLPFSLEQRDALAVPPGRWRLIGALEVLGFLGVGGTLLGLVPPAVGTAAAAGFVALMVGAIATRIRAKSPAMLVFGDVGTLALAVATVVAMVNR